MDSTMIQNLVWTFVKGCITCGSEALFSPATQFPTPALKDWSSKRALIGQALLSTPLLKSAKSGIDKMGLNPILDNGRLSER